MMSENGRLFRPCLQSCGTGTLDVASRVSSPCLGWCLGTSQRGFFRGLTFLAHLIHVAHQHDAIEDSDAEKRDERRSRGQDAALLFVGREMAPGLWELCATR